MGNRRKPLAWLHGEVKTPPFDLEARIEAGVLLRQLLHIAENELSAMTPQCVGGRRMGDIETFEAETAAWSEACNRSQRGVDWQFKTKNARGKLKYLYPKIIF